MSGDLAPQGQPTPTTSGEWVGWRGWRGDAYPFEYLVGPFYFRSDDDGQITCAFRVEQKHLNGSGIVHGGCMTTFADYATFCIGWDHLAGGPAVTVGLNCEFMGSATLGSLVEATGEVIKAGRALVFVRGIIRAQGSPLVSFTGIAKRIAAK